MSNPTLGRIKQSSLTVSNNTKRLFQVVFREQNKPEKKDDDEARIKVSELISKMSFYYEKIRNSVDYKEEHLLRKNAIERILRRLIIIEGSITVKNSRNIASHLLTELIRAAYLPNDKIKEEKIDEVAMILEKYLKLRIYSHSVLKEMSPRESSDMVNWILAIAASDIEEQLGRNKIDLTVVNYMYEILSSHVKLPDDFKYEKDRDIQIYLSIYRNYLKFDQDMLTFILFKYYNKTWQKPTDEEISALGKKICALKEAVKKQLDHPLSPQLNKVAGRYTVFFTVFLDVIKEDPQKVYEDFTVDPKAFSRQIKAKAGIRYAEARTKLWRAAIRSIIYIFITKSIFVFLIEVPATQIFGEEINLLALAVNVVFPAFLLFVVILFTKLPSEENTQKVLEGIEEIVFEEKKRSEFFHLKKPIKRGTWLNSFFGIMYAMTFFITFGAFVWTLNKIGFNFVNITIFLFFLAFVSFFSIRIRRSAKEYMIIQPKESVVTLLIDFFYVPIVQAGKWLSEKFSRINVFVFILDFIIEAPFKVFIEIAEEWTKYVKERKDDIV